MTADEQEFSGLVKRHKGTIYSVCIKEQLKKFNG